MNGHFKTEGHTHQEEVHHHAQEPLQHPPPRIHKNLQIRMDLLRFMENNRREETVEEKDIRLKVTLSQRESSRSIQRETQTNKDIKETENSMWSDSRRKQRQLQSQRM